MIDATRDVLRFQKMLGYKFGVHERVTPEAMSNRYNHMCEELEEIHVAMMMGEDRAGIVDGCADLAYLAVGTVLALGVDFDEIWHTVQRANMQKEPGENWKYAIKPVGWQPPDIEAAIKRGRRLTDLWDMK